MVSRYFIPSRSYPNLTSRGLLLNRVFQFVYSCSKINFVKIIARSITIIIGQHNGPFIAEFQPEWPITLSSFISIQQGHFCFTQMFVASCLHIGQRHFWCDKVLDFFFLSDFKIRYTHNINKNKPTPKKTNDTLTFTLMATINIPNKVNPIPLQKGQKGYFLVKVYYRLTRSYFFLSKTVCN
jgi:hypothetical protein